MCYCTAPTQAKFLWRNFRRNVLCNLGISFNFVPYLEVSHPGWNSAFWKEGWMVTWEHIVSCVYKCGRGRKWVEGKLERSCKYLELTAFSHIFGCTRRLSLSTMPTQNLVGADTSAPDQLILWLQLKILRLLNQVKSDSPAPNAVFVLKQKILIWLTAVRLWKVAWSSGLRVFSPKHILKWRVGAGQCQLGFPPNAQLCIVLRFCGSLLSE